MVEFLDVLTPEGLHTGLSKDRNLVHKDGDYHRAVHVWVYSESTAELLLQKRAYTKDSWPGLWDISSAGHISAGDTSLESARRELQEELGVDLPSDAFELLFTYKQNDILNDGTFINNEYNDVYLVTTLEPIPLEAFTLQESEVVDVKYMGWKNYKEVIAKKDPDYVDYELDGGYGLLFQTIESRYDADPKARIASLKKQLSRYSPVTLRGELSGLSEGDLFALVYTIRAAKILEKIFTEQEWCVNPQLKSWLEKKSTASEIDKLKYAYYMINKSPWSILDENEAFLSTADSAIILVENAVKPVSGWKGLEYKAAFPVHKPPVANFYPRDMDTKEFELWKATLSAEDQAKAVDFFTLIRRSQPKLCDLQIVPYSVEYLHNLKQASALLDKAGDSASTPSLKKLLKSKAKAFLSNDYYESDIAWMELDSQVDVTIGPYETYEDGLFGYKATFEAFIGICDEEATSQLLLFSNHLQEMENNLPMAAEYKSTNVKASPIRVINLVYNAGDCKGPQTVAFNLPNDDRIVKERGSAMVMIRNISEAKFDCILLPIARVCIEESQRCFVDFNSFFTHTICHECCHGIGPHNIAVGGKESTVRLELQELYSAIEEAKADIVGLWALHFLLDKGVLPQGKEKAIYVSFLAGCFRSIRFGLEEAHGRGQALQFNYILDKGGFVAHEDATFSVNFDKVRGAVEDLSREILTIEAQGDKPAALELLTKYAKLTPELSRAFASLESVQVPVDIAPTFDTLNSAAYLNAGRRID
ncbi:isopentenyl-diphosphate Delta-isomerase [Marchantia polymorpha subsp. ruderalis]|uniref:Nudix hydrolase domain-containing protein n=2 Tax=Marchantia polymorpha TaxID=3197 RepID=A0AAF6BRG3_MARPO|nr:hypothetical protein MARPO_0059s0059 [Marchantia polymorpha]BBN14597.1 hypothetical protein Mp_6g12890 [Marchantia polymorpha subsp. ruderalis]|eukprot:PTQ37124.1 hypothetical protein MARPO_0059s0059 [Marchantia polymorpha]